MTRSRVVYFRKKDKSIVLEGRENGKTILIWTLPDAETFLARIFENPSFLTKEKTDKIKSKFCRLDFREEKGDKDTLKVRSMLINRTSKNDEETPVTEETETKTDEKQESKKELTEEQKRLAWELAQ